MRISIGFPVSFTFILSSLVWAPSMMLGLVAVGAHHILNERHRRHLFNARRVLICQLCLTSAWCLFLIAFLATPQLLKPAVMLVLRLMKVMLRRGFSCALPHLREEGPGIVIFNSDAFSSLFFSVSAQSTTLIVIFGLMTLDLLKGLWTARNMYQMNKKMVALDMAMRVENEAIRRKKVRT